MKKNYFFYGMLFCIPLSSYFLMSSASGMSGALSGSPGDGGVTCNACHSSQGVNFNAVANITTNIPPTGYVPGNTYSISVSVTSTSTKHGFQLTAETPSNAKLGTFTAGTGNQVVNAGTGVTHTSAGTSLTSWTCSWTAPSTANTPVNFYAAVNATNANFNTSGDQVVTASRGYEVILGNDEYKVIAFQVYPNPTSDYLKINNWNQYNDTEVSIVSIQGQEIKKMKLDNNIIDVSNLKSGVYFLNLTNENQTGSVKFVKL